jgi:hypothetical protein
MNKHSKVLKEIGKGRERDRCVEFLEKQRK